MATRSRDGSRKKKKSNNCLQESHTMARNVKLTMSEELVLETKDAPNPLQTKGSKLFISDLQTASQKPKKCEFPHLRLSHLWGMRRDC